MDEEGVLDFLTSLEAMDLPDRIEEVNGKILSKIIEDTDYVAVLFCKCEHRFEQQLLNFNGLIQRFVTEKFEISLKKKSAENQFLNRKFIKRSGSW